MEYPRLVPNQVYHRKMKNWRWRARQKARERFSLEDLLDIVRIDDYQSVLKDLSHKELKPFIQKKKHKRNLRRNELTRWSIRRPFPEDITRRILTFTRFK